MKNPATCVLPTAGPAVALKRNGSSVGKRATYRIRCLLLGHFWGSWYEQDLVSEFNRGEMRECQRCERAEWKPAVVRVSA